MVHTRQERTENACPPKIREISLAELGKLAQREYIDLMTIGGFLNLKKVS